MPLSENFPKAIGFVLDADAGESQEPLGTAFLVRYPARTHRGAHYYFVSAAHGVAREMNYAVRVRNKEGGVCDLPVSNWFCHHREDVAHAPVDGSLILAHDIATIPTDAFYDHRPADENGDHLFDAHLGDDVFFLGLLGDIPEMVEQNVPMVRSGTIGAFSQTGVSIRDFGKLGPVHLIDCRSYEGFSGSPCFVQFAPTADGLPQRGLRAGGPLTLLFGVVAGHFDGPEPDRTIAGEAARDPRGSRHTGVGVVTPVEALTELLEDEEQVSARAATEDAWNESHPEGRISKEEAETDA